MEGLRSKIPPIILEVRKQIQHESLLSLFNMSLVEFLEYFSIDAQVVQLQIQSHNQKGRLVEQAFSDGMNLNDLQGVVQEYFPNGVSIDILLENNHHIDSNFVDEIFFSFHEAFNPHQLINNILTSRELEDKYIIPMEEDTFCYVLEEGKMKRYPSFQRFLNHE